MQLPDNIVSIFVVGAIIKQVAPFVLQAVFSLTLVKGRLSTSKLVMNA